MAQTIFEEMGGTYTHLTGLIEMKAALMFGRND